MLPYSLLFVHPPLVDALCYVTIRSILEQIVIVNTQNMRIGYSVAYFLNLIIQQQIFSNFLENMNQLTKQTHIHHLISITIAHYAIAPHSQPFPLPNKKKNKHDTFHVIFLTHFQLHANLNFS